MVQGPEWPGPQDPPGPQLINEVLYYWWQQPYRDGIARMRAAGMTWFEIGNYTDMDPRAAKKVYG